MNKMKRWLMLTMVICLTTVCVVEIIAKSPSDKTGISIRKIEEQVVLYTIYRRLHLRSHTSTVRLYWRFFSQY